MYHTFAEKSISGAGQSREKTQRKYKKQIPEEKLIAACCEVLNTASFDEEVFHSKVEQIIIPKPNNIRFLFSDGLERTVTWQDRSRSESWTPERRARTGQQTRERSKKCRK